MNMLLLTTPAQHEGTNPSVLLEEKQLQAWLDDLPMMNIIDTVKALHQSLVPFNELQLEDSLRLKLLEQYRQVIDEIFYSFDEMRLKQLPVSNQVRQEIKTDIMWLCLELANGYKIVVKNTLDQGSNPRKDSNLVLAIYRSMEQIIRALVNAYRNRQLPPPLAYLEINQLYRLAETHAITKKKVSHAKQETAVPTISHLFKQFMLLAVADPVNIPEAVAFELFIVLEAFAHQCQISESHSSASWVYVVNLAEDELPKRMPQSGDTASNPDIRYIDTDAVFRQIEARIGELKQASQDMIDTQEIKLLQIYQQQAAEGVSTERNNVNPLQKQVRLSFGLEATHYFMTDDHYARHQAAGSESYGIEVRDVDDEQPGYELESWHTLEDNMSGRMLLVPRDISYQEIELGMLVGLFEQVKGDNPAVFTLAMVRWLPPNETDEKKIGLQIIPGRPQSMVCSAEENEDLIPCLYISAVAVLNQPASLIVPADIYQQGKLIDLHLADGKRSVEFTDIIEQTPYIIQCLCKNPE
jgi:hypothetical protein